MTRIKRQCAILRDWHGAGQDALSECVASIILEELRWVAKFIYETSHASIGGPHHRATVLDAAENCVGQMLFRSRGPQKPSIVRDVDQKVCAVHHKSAHQIAHRIFETNQRRNPRGLITHVDYRELGAA